MRRSGTLRRRSWSLPAAGPCPAVAFQQARPCGRRSAGRVRARTASRARLALLAHPGRPHARSLAQVTWVGRSSMEVLITLSSRPPPVMPSTPESAWSSNGPTKSGDDHDDAQGPSASSARRHHASGAGAGRLASLTQHELPPGTLGSAWRFEGFARFVMAMRDTAARRAVQVAPLAPETQRERELFEQGNEHHVSRKQVRRGRLVGLSTARVLSRAFQPQGAIAFDSWVGRLVALVDVESQKRESHWRNKPPSDAEVRLIHQLAVSNLDGATGSSGGGGIAGILGARSSASRANPFHVAGGEGGGAENGSAALNLQGGSPLPAVPMHTTELCSTQLMHSQVSATSGCEGRGAEAGLVRPVLTARFASPARLAMPPRAQDRNHFSYIFGGHLMRLAFEHAYTTAAMHAGVSGGKRASQPETALSGRQSCCGSRAQRTGPVCAARQLRWACCGGLRRLWCLGGEPKEGSGVRRASREVQARERRTGGEECLRRGDRGSVLAGGLRTAGGKAQRPGQGSRPRWSGVRDARVVAVAARRSGASP